MLGFSGIEIKSVPARGSKSKTPDHSSSPLPELLSHMLYSNFGHNPWVSPSMAFEKNPQIMQQLKERYEAAHKRNYLLQRMLDLSTKSLYASSPEDKDYYNKLMASVLGQINMHDARISPNDKVAIILVPLNAFKQMAGIASSPVPSSLSGPLSQSAMNPLGYNPFSMTPLGLNSPFAPSPFTPPFMGMSHPYMPMHSANPFMSMPSPLMSTLSSFGGPAFGAGLPFMSSG
ncbi:hypothetical protein HZS_1522, partial [Henneguya salminicola]